MAVARTRDGIVEAMELKPDGARAMPFLLSVQFHPERFRERYANTGRFFASLLKHAGGDVKHESQILIVDDEADLRNLLASVLEDQYEVSQAVNGAGLLQRPLPSQPADVVLLDVKLPDADGLELLPQSKSAGPNTEVIVPWDTAPSARTVLLTGTRRRLQFSLQAEF